MEYSKTVDNMLDKLVETNIKINCNNGTEIVLTKDHFLNGLFLIQKTKPPLIFKNIITSDLLTLNIQKNEKYSIILNVDELCNPELKLINEIHRLIDNDKTILYYLARKGNIQVLEFLLSKLGEDHLKELLIIQLTDG